MLKPTSSDDPGGEQSPRFHEGAPHRPIVNVTNSRKEVVQNTPQVSYPHSDEALFRLRKLLKENRVNGEVDGGLLRHPSGNLEEGTLTHAFPIMLSEEYRTAAVEEKLAETMREFVRLTPGAEFHGFVAHATQVIYDMVTAQAKAEHEQRQEEWLALIAAKRQEQQEGQRQLLHVVGADGTVTNVDGGGGAVELSHETSARNGEQREEDRDDIGTRAAANA